MQLIQTIELTQTTANVNFYNIPQDGIDLVLMVSSRGNSTVNALCKINNLSTSCPQIAIGADSPPTTVSGSYANNNGIFIYNNKSTSTAGTYNNHKLHIPNYTRNSEKVAYTEVVREDLGALNNIRSVAVRINIEDPVFNLRLVGDDYVSGSVFSLYKITAD